MLKYLFKLIDNSELESEYQKRGLGKEDNSMSEQDVLLSLYKDYTKTIDVDFTKPHELVVQNNNNKFFYANTVSELKEKIFQFSQVYKNPVFVPYIEALINEQALFTLSEAKDDMQIMAGRMKIIAFSQILEAFKKGNEMYENSLKEKSILSDEDKFTVI